MNFCPGVYEDLPAEEYHALPAISKSGLDRVHESIPAYLAWAKNGKDTRAMRRGRALHTYVLEGKKAFRAEFAVAPAVSDMHPSSKDYRYWKEDHDAAGRDIITRADFEDIEGMRDTLFALLKSMSERRHPGIRKLFSDAMHVESSFLWLDETWQIPARCRTDLVSAEALIVDVKSARDVTDRGIGRAMAEHRYHVQDPWYRRGFEAATGVRPVGFVFIFILSARPWTARLVDIPAGWIAEGEAQMCEDAERFARFYHDGLGLEIQPIDLPHWAAY